MKSLNRLFLFILTLTAIFGFSQLVYAVTPTLSVSSTGSGDSVQVNVTGDPNSSVMLFYAGQQFSNIGTTNANGNLSAIVSSATYGITANSSVRVAVGGIAGAQSPSVAWPYFQSSSTTSNFTLSQTALLLNAGQTSTITASASYLYVLTNSNPAVANINLNANQVTVSANTYGSTTANICVVGSTTNCASVVITVQSSGVSQLTFSQNNFSIVSGQSVPVTISGGSGSYVVSNNPNSTSIQTSINGSVITLTATSTSGSSSITVCTTGLANCGIINVSATAVNSTAVTFSQTNPFVQIGQSTTVTIYGGTGTNFYVSANSNPSIVQANITSNILTLVGNVTTGTSTISICAYAGTCATLTANVGTATGSSGTITLSQSSVSVLAGQSSTITISGGSAPYTFSAPNSANVFSGVINGNILTIYGVNPGSSTASVCASIGCTNLSVTVNNVNASINPPTFSQNNILMTTGQQTTVYITGNNGYYISNNSSSGVATGQISGSALAISAISVGSSTILVCQSGGLCSSLYITVSAPVVQTPVVTPVTPTVTTQPAYVLSRYLGAGDKGDDVLKLQKLLSEKGYLTATPNGYYGVGTKSAVQKFQKANGIKQTGNVGQATKDALNKIWASATTSSKESQIATLQQAIQQLMAQATQMQGK